MTVNYVGSIDYTKWQPLSNVNQNQNANEANASYLTQQTQGDYYVSESGETCTDGKDDGKIGFFGAIGNAIKGIGKTIVNGVKGMFTDSEGKFSLGKTLLSIGTVALCIAVPAVGVAACAVGGVMGAVQVGKGIYSAATAETDAEAKEAWQNIGGGAFTAAISVVGAKAGVKSVKASSTAGTNGGSALSEVGKNASLLKKVNAFGKDAISSTKNNISKIKTNILTKAGASETHVSDLKTSKELLKEAKKSGNADEIAAAKELVKETKSSVRADIKENIGSYKEAAKINSLRNKASNIKGATTDAESKLLQELEIRETFASDSTKTVLNNIETAKSQISNTLSNVGTKTLDALRHPIKTAKSIPSGISGTAAKVWQAIKENASYEQLVNKFGQETVDNAILAIGTVYSIN